MIFEKIHFLPILKISVKIRTNPDQNWSGPEIRTKTRTTLSDQHGPVRDSGPPDRTKKSWSGIPDHFIGPTWSGPEIRTTGPDRNKLVRNSGPPDRTKLSWSGNPDHRTGPKLNWSGIPDHSGPTRTNINLVRSGHPCSELSPLYNQKFNFEMI